MSSLREKTALVLGAGGLGGPAALVLFPLLPEEALGAPRGAATARALARLFPDMEVPHGQGTGGTGGRNPDSDCGGLLRGRAGGILRA